MHVSRPCRILLLCLALLLGTAGSARAALSLWVEDPNVKVRPGARPGAARAIELKAARNEYEPCQIVVTDDGGLPLEDVDAEVTDLRGPGGAVIGAGRIDLYREHFIEVRRGSHKPERESDLGLWPDALIPFEDPYFGETRGGAPFDVPAGELRVLWMDVYVPPGTPAGPYTGTLTVTAAPGQEASVPVRLTVWEFTLPEKLTVASSFGWSCGGCASGHERLGSAVPDRKALAGLYFQEALRHRMTLRGFESCADLPYVHDPEEDRIVFDWTEHDAWVAPALDGGLLDTGAAFNAASIPRPGIPDGLQVLYWRAYAEHYREKGWLDKLYLYLPDEPTPDDYPRVAQMADRLHEADPDLRAMVTEQLAEPLLGHIDIWCPDTPFLGDTFGSWPAPEDYPPRQALGEEVWWYNCMSVQFVLDYPNYFIDSQGWYARIFAWLTRRFQFTGILYWHTLYAWNQSGKDPWTDPYEIQFWCNGDGTLFYPGTPSKIGGTTDIPVASIRMKMIREGMEDYEYFHILDGMGEQAYVQEELERVASRTWSWCHDSTRLMNLRERMARKILGLPSGWEAAPVTAATAGQAATDARSRGVSAVLALVLVVLPALLLWFVWQRRVRDPGGDRPPSAG